jgi:N-formylglutamate amidohydrolase
MPFEHVVVHIPHSSVSIPEDYRSTIALDDETLSREIIAMTDAFCDELYGWDEEFPARIVFPVSRLVCDVERFRNDQDEPCAQKGQGLMYLRGMDYKKIRDYDETLRNRILAELYDPHHARLTAAVDQALEACGRCTILDGHSFSSSLPVLPISLFDLPDFCIGTDRFHTPPALRNAMAEACREHGYSVKINFPYSGTITPMKHYGTDNRVLSVMVEVNRKLYQNERTMTKSDGFEKTKEMCRVLMETAARFGEGKTAEEVWRL